MTTRRAVSRRYMALLTGGPLLTDLMLTLITFSMNLALVRQGLPPKLQAWMLTLFALGYTLSANFGGRIITPRSAGILVVISNVLLAATGSLGMRLQSYPLLLAMGTLVGVTAAVYFVGFQVKMGNVQPFSRLVWIVAFYNVSWGSGWSLGPLIRGVMEQHADYMLGIIWIPAAVHLLLCAIGLWGNEKLPTPEQAAPVHDFASTPVQRIIGWTGVLVASVLLNGVYALWPQLGKLNGISEKWVGLGVFVMGIQIPIWAVVLALLGKRTHRPHLLWAMLLLGGIGYWLLPQCFTLAGEGGAYPLALLFLGICGVGISGGFFHSVLYSNADPLHPAKSVGINESLVGMGNILGPLVMGTLAWDNAANPLPYRTGLLFAAGVSLAGMVIWANRHRIEPRL